ncbi:MAG: FG-GAP-like repeat-containing protein, partial [Flavobacteriales bacterium]
MIDLVVTGENENAESVTKLYDGTKQFNQENGFVENTEISLKGLRNSTAKWVDYDLDGDLDLFLSGTSDEGEFTKLYRTDLLNKNNTPSAKITNLAIEDLGFGKVKLTWDVPIDDFSDNLGYVIRLATTEGGTEISNTESNLLTGQRLITKSPVIYNNSYETLLNPGVYYWSVQSVDDGLKGSEFSEENSFVLTYEWKELNQGGIIDRSINAVSKPIVKLTDIDLDNDMDLIYSSREEDNDVQIFTLGEDKFLYSGNLQDSRNVSDMKFLDINFDKIQDVLINTWRSESDNSLKLYTTGNGNIPQEDFRGPGLYQSKIELIDINNDGYKEVVHIGRTNAEANSELKVYVYEQLDGSLTESPLDISAQFNSLKSGAYGFGNFDNDEDIDFAITGLTNTGITSNLFLNETEFTDDINPIYSEIAIDFAKATDSTLDFFDYDGDGDLDIAITGQGVSGPMFKILSNNGLSGSDLAFEEVPNTGLIPIREAKVDFGDYNGDGYTDILYSGKVSGQGQVTKLVEYNPETNTYVDSSFDLSNILNASIAFGDVDGDNDLDFAIAGENATSNNQNIIKTYLNVRDLSAEVLEGQQGAKNSDALEYLVNEKPSQPANLESEVIGFNNDTDTYQVKLTWDATTDDTTPSEGLTYALKVGTTAGGDDIMSTNSLTNGYRLSAGKGNVEHKTTWIINIPDLPDNKSYHWSVQAVDASFSGSDFSLEKTVDVYAIKLGDSDGNTKVDVLDLVQNIDYILGNDPKPFVFESADVNNDEKINVLDIVGTVDIILNPDNNSDKSNKKAASYNLDYYSNTPIGDAIFTWEGNDLYVSSEFDLGGIQMLFNRDFEYNLSDELAHIKNLEYSENNQKTVMLYSFNNTSIGNSKTKILTKTNNIPGLEEENIVVGTVNGSKLNAIYNKNENGAENEFEGLNLYPNPTEGFVNITYNLKNQMDFVIVNVFDINGRLVKSQKLPGYKGNNKNNLKLNNLSSGSYLITIEANKGNSLKYFSRKMLILK